jgi:stress response protein SCP2
MQTINMTKGQSLDLKKEDGSAIPSIRVGLGWDVSAGKTMDLDLFVVRKSDKKVAYFNDQKALEGVTLSDDNLTGEGDGDDEFTVLHAPTMPDGTYVVCLNIYDGASKGQSFADVLNAVANVYNHETNEVLATFKVTENGGASTALIIGEIEDMGDYLKFTAKTDFLNGSIDDVVKSL